MYVLYCIVLYYLCNMIYILYEILLIHKNIANYIFVILYYQ
jgi:hypothetical protein